MVLTDQVLTNFLLLTFSKNAVSLFTSHWLSSRQPNHPVAFQNTICYCICRFNFDLCGGSCDLSPGPHRIHIHTTPAEFHRSFPKIIAENTTKILFGPVFTSLRRMIHLSTYSLGIIAHFLKRSLYRFTSSHFSSLAI